MLYRKDRYGNDISQLGYGCMRFTKKGTAVDYEKTKSEIIHAIEAGVNYFDTAYIYPGSEEALGRILEESGQRKNVNIATKLPQYLMRSKEQIEKTFKEELSRLRTDYIDYYLMHMFTDYSEWEHLNTLEIKQWIEDKKASGAIRNHDPEALIKGFEIVGYKREEVEKRFRSIFTSFKGSFIYFS